MIQDMHLSVELGEYRCSHDASGTNNETLCAIKDMDGKQALPPVIIRVDFGDGSGEQV